MINDYSYFRANKLVVTSPIMFNLWVAEISGQISDGKWENSPGMLPWYAIECKLDTEAEHSGLYIKNWSNRYHRTPNIVARDLIENVGDRMFRWITLGACGYLVDDDRHERSAAEEMARLAERRVDTETALEALKNNDNGRYTGYKGFSRLGLSEDEFRILYADIVEYLKATENLDRTKVVRGALKDLHLAMKNHKFNPCLEVSA